MNNLPRVNILGVGISAINMETALRTIDNWIDKEESHYICVTPVHSVMECQKDLSLRRIFNASGLTTPDGMPLVWLCHLNGYKTVDRVYGPDLLLAVCEHSLAKGYSHFFYGGAPGIPERLVENLRRRYPSLAVAGTHSPPFRLLTSEEDEQIVQTINEASPDVVWVGLGSPKQERWMAEHAAQLDAPVLIGIGAAFDFHAGCKKQAPHWMQRSGLEWLFRLITEPQRLWRRYLVNNPIFVTLILLQALGLRRYPLEPR